MSMWCYLWSICQHMLSAAKSVSPLPLAGSRARLGVEHWTLPILQCVVFSIQCTEYSVQCSVYSVQLAMCSCQGAVYSVQYTESSIQFTVCSEQYKVCSLQYAVLYGGCPMAQYKTVKENYLTSNGWQRFSAYLDRAGLEKASPTNKTGFSVSRFFHQIRNYLSSS